MIKLFFFFSPTGYVLDVENHPISNAKLTVETPELKMVTFTSELGEYKIINLPTGSFLLLAEAPHHIAASQMIHIGTIASVRNVMFRLEIDEHVLGMPRLVFIFLAGFACVGLVALCAMVIVRCQERRKAASYYNFSLLPQKETKKLFEDDDDETVLFSSPVKSANVEPYYDDVLEPLSATDDDSDSDEVIMLSSRSREYHDEP